MSPHRRNVVAPSGCPGDAGLPGELHRPARGPFLDRYPTGWPDGVLAVPVVVSADVVLLARAGTGGQPDVSFLAAEEVDGSARFATSDIDRGAGVGWRWLPTGEPVLENILAWVHVLDEASAL